MAHMVVSLHVSLKYMTDVSGVAMKTLDLGFQGGVPAKQGGVSPCR